MANRFYVFVCGRPGTRRLYSEIPYSARQIGENLTLWLGTHPAIGDWNHGRWIETERVGG